jgi:hypothetical protein
MSDLALLGLLVPLGAFIIAALWITAVFMFEASVKQEIVQ